MQDRAELGLGRSLRSHVLEVVFVFILYAVYNAFSVTSCPVRLRVGSLVSSQPKDGRTCPYS